MSFRDDFLWGAAAAAYQIEGGWQDDGKGLSVWDVFSHTRGKTFEGHTGDVACDHYHRYKEDVALWKSIGIKAYRGSINWPRVLPDGVGRVNEKGLDFYSRLVDELLANGITPYITLFHWEYPYELYCRGSWLNPESPDWFAEFTSVVVERLSDRVRHWITLNEPGAFVHLGYRAGIHAPGMEYNDREMAQVVHHVLLAHGKSVQAIRAGAKTPAQVSLAPSSTIRVPASDDPADIEAARQSIFSVVPFTFNNNVAYLDPIYLGELNAGYVEAVGENLPQIGTNDLKTISQPLDYYGMNFYSGGMVKAGPDGKPQNVSFEGLRDLTAFRWPVVPEGAYWGPKYFYERYKKPIYITENGLSNVDWKFQDGKVHDPQRIEFLTRYLSNLKRAAADGVDVRGYFQWSIMDNFEWAHGYKERFGLIHVDYQTLERTLKDSAHWYRGVIESNGENIPAIIN